MPSTVERATPCRKKLRIEIPPDRVAGVRTEILRDFRREANIPGFRAGHAPEPMVEKRYASAIDEELRRRLVPDAYREALAEHKLKAVGYPQIEKVDYEAGQPMVVTAAVDTAPEFGLPNYKGLTVKKKPVEVKDEDLTQTLEALRDQQADFADVTGRALKTGDFAVINYSGVLEGKPVGDIAPSLKNMGERKDFWLLVQSDSFLPGFCDQLLGAPPGEKRQVLVDFPADFPQKALAGKKATYFVDVTAIKEKKLPELNDEFAKKVGAESLEKLKEDVRKGIVTEREQEVNAELRKQIVDTLLAGVEFDLPESLVAQETRSIVYDVVRDNTMRGATKEQLEQKKDEIFGFATKSARDRLKASFVLDAVAEAENIKVEDAEVENRIVQMAQRYRVTPERLKAQLAEKGGLAEVNEQILVGKTLDFLLANAKVETA